MGKEKTQQEAVASCFLATQWSDCLAETRSAARVLCARHTATATDTSKSTSTVNRPRFLVHVSRPTGLRQRTKSSNACQSRSSTAPEASFLGLRSVIVACSCSASCRARSGIEQGRNDTVVAA